MRETSLFYIFVYLLVAGMGVSCLDTATKSSTADPGVIIGGVKWATRNVDVPGTFAATPERAGMFYQWNRRMGWSGIDPMTASDGGTTWYPTNEPGDGWASENDPCPEGWRLPGMEEVYTLLDEAKVTHEWVDATEATLAGRRFTEKATGNSIFLPAPGFREYSDGVLNRAGIMGNYWSSDANDTTGGWGWAFGSNNARPLGTDRSYGRVVRCIEDGYSEK